MSNAEQVIPLQAIVRSARVEDFWDIMHVERMCFPTPWPEAAMWEDLAQLGERKVYLVIESAGELLGYIGAHCFAGEVHIVTLAVTPKCRGMGLGELLLLTLIDLVTSKGAQYATLEYRASNQAAERLYSKLGFVRRGLRKRYYPDTDEDAIIANLENLQQSECQQSIAHLTAAWRKRNKHDLRISL